MRARYFVSFNAIIEEKDYCATSEGPIEIPARLESKTLNTCIDAERMENIGDLRIIEDGIAKQTPNCTNVTIINFQEL